MRMSPQNFSDGHLCIRWQMSYPAFLMKMPTTEISLERNVFVALYSCNKYLDDRVSTAFSAWFKDLSQEKAIFAVGETKNNLRKQEPFKTSSSIWK